MKKMIYERGNLKNLDRNTSSLHTRAFCCLTSVFQHTKHVYTHVFEVAYLHSRSLLFSVQCKVLDKILLKKRGVHKLWQIIVGKIMKTEKNGSTVFKLFMLCHLTCFSAVLLSFLQPRIVFLISVMDLNHLSLQCRIFSVMSKIHLV